LAIFMLGGSSLAALPTPARGAASEPTANQTIDRLIEERMGRAGIVGLAAAILVDGRVVWTAGYGFADRESGRPFTTDTVMNVGSIAKTVVGVALLQAAAQGKLRLDDDVNLHLPFRVRNPRHEDVPITLRQLATHTSGITDRDPVYTDSYHQGGDSPVALGDFLREYFVPTGRWWSADNFVAGKPGSVREYSNIGAGLAAYAVERATGRPFHESTRDAIFRPLGMTGTGWFLSEIDRASHATLYDASGGPAKPIPVYGLATWPDGGLRTSVDDLSRFFAALLGDGAHEGARILSPASVEELRRFQYTAASKPDNVDLDEKNSGIFWSTKRNTSLVGHSGSDPGVQAEMLAEPSRRVAVILLSNTTLAGRKQRAFLEIFEALLARGREIAGLPR
jgi:CubicO group peptidase (beta-lactamase class C family)